MKKTLLTVLVSFPLMVGCGSLQQGKALSTLIKVHDAGVTAFDTYIGSVFVGAIPTNDVPRASQQFNQFQVGSRLAITAAQLASTNPPVAVQFDLAVVRATSVAVTSGWDTNTPPISSIISLTRVAP